MSIKYWGHASPVVANVKDTRSLLYWGAGFPITVLCGATGSVKTLTTTCAVGSATPQSICAIQRQLSTIILPVSACADCVLGGGTFGTDPGSYTTPNVCGLDATCQARWRFEVGDSIQDFINGNALTSVNGCQALATQHMEGSASQYFDSSLNQYLTRPDANLSPYFPGKNGNDFVGNISMWFYFTGGNSPFVYYTLFSKGGVYVDVWGNGLRVIAGGSTFLATGITNNRWYHISVNFDGINKAIAYRLYDSTTNAVTLLPLVCSSTWTGGTDPFQIGANNGAAGTCFSGYIDETVVWNRKLTVQEMELVQQQYFHGRFPGLQDNTQFSNDANCQAAWPAEVGTEGTDIVHANNISPTANSKCPILFGENQGGFFLDQYGANALGAEIADASLSSNFPLKSSDSVKKMTFCAWVTPSNRGGYGGGFIGKHYYDYNDYSIEMATDGSNHLLIGWGNGTSWTKYDTGIVLTEHQAHHIGVKIDGLAPSIAVRVFHNYTGAVDTYSVAPTGALVLGSHNFAIGKGGQGYGELSRCWVDQIILWNRLLSDAEIDAVRNGTFSAAHVPQTYNLVSTIAAVSSATTPIYAIRRNCITSVSSVSSTANAVLFGLRQLQTAIAVATTTSTPTLLRLLTLTTNIGAVSSNTNAILAVLRDLSTVVASVSSGGLPILGILRHLVTASSSSTSSSAAVVAILRELLTTILSESASMDANIRALRLLTVNMAADTGTVDPILAVLRKLITNIQILSIVSDMALDISAGAVTRNLVTNVASVSQTTVVTLKVLRDLITAITGSTSTASSILHMTLKLATSVAVGTQSSAVALDILRHFLTAIGASSATSASALDILRDLITTVSGTSQDSQMLLLVLRKLTTNAAIESNTVDVSLLFGMVTHIMGVTSTNTIDVAVMRHVATTVTAQTTTAGMLRVLRELLTNAVVTTSTNGVICDIIKGLITTIAASTSTAAPLLLVQRELNTLLHCSTITTAMLLRVLRDITTVINLGTDTVDFILRLKLPIQEYLKTIKYHRLDMFQSTVPANLLSLPMLVDMAEDVIAVGIEEPEVITLRVITEERPPAVMTIELADKPIVFELMEGMVDVCLIDPEVKVGLANDMISLYMTQDDFIETDLMEQPVINAVGQD